MAITAQTLYDRFGVLVQDTSHQRWTQGEFLSWLSEAMVELTRLNPSANARTLSVELTPGQTRQTLPTGTFVLINLVANAGADGSTPGQAIRKTTRETLDSTTPSWHTAANALGYVTHYIYETGDPNFFYVSPKAPDTPLYVEGVFGKLPDAVNSLSASIEVRNEYATQLLNYVCYRAFSKEDEAGAAAKAQAFYALFTSALTGA